ncbi:MAG: hypothetical protein LQ351_000024 [Letrouitia transgressa]|nr:MAG: hypothetical protein LQ351_000024 [Letrouitia transgressa]
MNKDIPDIELVRLSGHLGETVRPGSSDGDRTGLLVYRHKNIASAAFQKTSSLPLLQCVVHCLSVLFTVAVLRLNWKNVYFADITLPNVNSILNAFQFVARLHEVIVSASLLAILLYHLRYELCASAGLPLSYLAAPFQLSTLQPILEKSFWSALAAKDETRRTYWFGVSILVATILTALVGPSSAILLLPQLKWWTVEDPFSGTIGFSYLNDSYDNIWPKYVNRSSFVPGDCFDDDHMGRPPDVCPYANMVGISRWSSDYNSQFAPPNITAASGANMLRYVSSSSYNDTADYAVASTSMSQLARDFGTIWLYGERQNLTYAKSGRPMLKLSSRDVNNPILRPLVQVQCSSPYNVQDKESMTVSFPSDKLVTSTGESPLRKNITQEIKPMQFENDGQPKVQFIDLSAEAGRPILGVLVGMTFAWPQALFNVPSDSSDIRGLTSCTTISHWVPTTMARDAVTDNVVIVDHPDPLAIISSSSLMDKARSINVDISYAEAQNVLMPNNMTAIEFELAWLSFTSEPIQIYNGSRGDKWPYLVSTLLSLQLSDALARINQNTPMLVYCKDCNDPLFNVSKKSFVKNIADLNLPGSVQIIPDSSVDTLAQDITEHPELYTPIQWRFEHFGYAWAFDRVTKILAAVVVFLHSLLVVAHLLVVVCVRRWRCDSWGNLIELIVLAVQSPPAAILRGTSTGINDTSTYTDTVLIRESDELEVNDGNQRAIIVVTDPANRHEYQSRKLQRDKKYL